MIPRPILKLILPTFHTRLLAAAVLALLTACAPNPSMIATLTLLPGTPTPRPPTPWPSITPRIRAATATLAPAKCPTSSYDTAAPEDPSQMIGRAYDLDRLPEEFSEPESGLFADDPLYRWVRVRWQGRSVYWIDHQICVDTFSRAHREVVDVLALPRLDPALGEIETRACARHGEDLPGVIAYGMLNEDQTLNIQGAYAIGEQFMPIDAGDLTCKAGEE